MTAPSLILLGHGSSDPRAAQVGHDLRTALVALRPELDVHVGFLDHCPPTGAQLLDRLVDSGVTEIVLVPLLVSEAFSAEAEVPVLLAKAHAEHPGVRVLAARPVGPEISLLRIVDRRLREALRRRRVFELDGLVFSAAGSSDVRSNALIARRARQWSHHHKLPCVTAYATGSGPSAGEAVRTLRAQGRRHIAVGSWFLSPSRIYTASTELAYTAGAIAVSEPLGPEPEVAETALSRYLVAAMDLVDLQLDDETDAEAEAAERHLRVVPASA